MGTPTFSKVSKRPLIIVTVSFIIIIVIVGAVTWKVTKDAYESPASDAVVATRPPLGVTSGENSSRQSITTPEYTPEELEEKPWLSLRMSRHVLPIHYDIVMYPDFYEDHGTFYGNETIEVEVKKATKFFLIHIHNTYLNVTKASVVDNVTGENLEIVKTTYYAPNEFFVMEMRKPVSNAVNMILEFEGSLTKAIFGIYKSTYFDTQANVTRQLATSKFEPTYARQAFPCFDEPNIKAEYTITLVHRDGYTALSNMPEMNRSTYQWDTGLVATTFQRSVKMSTYLVCFIVCNFAYIETTSNRSIPIRVYATHDKISQANYSLDIAKYTLDFYESLFDMEYPLPKLDMIAIPDFVSGAMEHWGLITYRESRLLYNPDASSLTNKESVATVVAHEVAHQWFGNIVTMDWWNDLWLNEGFASYMEYVGTQDKEPTWNMEYLNLINDLFSVMDDDAVISSHPIIVDVHSPSEITSVFDAISYSKGASVIKMLEAFMGKEEFFKGVSAYLKKFQWANAKTDDLWEALSEVENENIKYIMDTWTIQDGFPYINISISTNTNGESTFQATQKRFMSNPGTVVDPSASPLGYKWYVSLAYNTSSGTSGHEIMNLTDISFSKNVGLNDSNNWIKFNYQQHGFYIVLYPDDMWDRFSKHLLCTPYQNWTLSVPDRAGLLNDAFNLAPAGLTSYRIPLGMMSYLAQERELVPWQAALDSGIIYINNNMKTDPDYLPWKKFLASRIQPAVDRLGFIDTGSHNERKLRSTLLDVAGNVQDAATVSNITVQWRQWLDKDIYPSVNLRRSVYKYGMMYAGTAEDWQKVWNKYLKESSPQEKELLAMSLSYATQSYLIIKLLDYAKREDGIKRQDFFTVLQYIGYNDAAKGILWDWAREHYQFFIDRFTVADRSFGLMIYYMVRRYNTEFKLQEVKDFFAKYPDEGASARYRKMAIESIEQNINWMKYFKPVVLDWLKNNADNSAVRSC